MVALCQNNALGWPYYVGLKRVFPAGASVFSGASIEPFHHLQLSYYWTQRSGGVSGKGRQLFSLSSGQADVTEVNDAYYHVLAMIPKQSGPIGGTAPTCQAGSRLVLYTEGPAARQAVYDCETGISWLADGNLAATSGFNLTGNVSGGINYKRPYPVPRPISLTVPKVNNGAMMWESAQQWIAALNAHDGGKGYLGSTNWQMPDSPADLKTLYDHLQLGAGDARFVAQVNSGPFRNLQPFFYWELCTPEPDDTGASVGKCANGDAPSGKRGREMSFDFTFGYGLLSTDLSALDYFVMVYYPAGSPAAKPASNAVPR